MNMDKYPTPRTLCPPEIDRVLHCNMFPVSNIKVFKSTPRIYICSKQWQPYSIPFSMPYGRQSGNSPTSQLLIQKTFFGDRCERLNTRNRYPTPRTLCPICQILIEYYIAIYLR